MEKAVKEMRDRKATENDDMPGNVLKLLGKDDVKMVTQMPKNIYKTGEWSQNSSEVIIVALEKKTRASKSSDHCTGRLIAHTANIVTRICRRIKRKIEVVFGGRGGGGQIR
jgi:hypothetical protein